ncbi:MAG: hypothetical protein KF716_33490 [Anaerolineae bacterium]|nr:hypothetical protein [Anaerolineae bacterium]
MEFGNVVAVLLVLAVVAVVIERIINFRRNRPRPAPPMTAEEWAAAQEAARIEEERADNAFWEANRPLLKRLMQEIAQHSNRTDLRLIEDSTTYSMSLRGRAPTNGEYAFVTISTRQQQFSYTARVPSETGRGDQESASVVMATVDELRAWLTDQWTYGE